MTDARRARTRLRSICLIAVAAMGLAVGTGAARAQEIAWMATSYLVSIDPATGLYTRRGLAIFATGEVAPFTAQGQVRAGIGNSQTVTARIVYTFEDGSTIVQEGEALVERQSPTRSRQAGVGRLVSGTGRFEGISGHTTSTGRGLTEWDNLTEFKAEYSIAGR